MLLIWKCCLTLANVACTENITETPPLIKSSCPALHHTRSMFPMLDEASFEVDDWDLTWSLCTIEPQSSEDISVKEERSCEADFDQRLFNDLVTAAIRGFLASQKESRMVRSIEDAIEAYEELIAQKVQVKLGWRQIASHFPEMSEKKARQKFEQLKNRVSKPKNLGEILRRADALLEEGRLPMKGMLHLQKEEFRITASLKSVRNHIYVRMKK